MGSRSSRRGQEAASVVLEGVVLEGVVLSELPQGEVAGRREGPHRSLSAPLMS